MGERGFTLVEVLVALLIVALGLAALMTTIGSAANTSAILRDKTLAEWIAMNRLVEVRLNLPPTDGSTTGNPAPGDSQTADQGNRGTLRFANREWHYDTRYANTSVPSMRRVTVRVWAGKRTTKAAPLAVAIGFVGTDVAPPGSSNAVDWTAGSVPVANGATAGPTGTTLGPTGTTLGPTGAPVSPGGVP